MEPKAVKKKRRRTAPRLTHTTCNKGCCHINTVAFDDSCRNFEFTAHSNQSKAGVCMLNMFSGKILLVQSCGNKFGLPKGSIERGETKIQCAIRELKEETGIQVTKNLLQKYASIDDTGYYYLCYAFTEEGRIQYTHGVYNDATGIAWIHIDCLKQMIKQRQIKINSHTRKIIEKLEMTDVYKRCKEESENSEYAIGLLSQNPFYLLTFID